MLIRITTIERRRVVTVDLGVQIEDAVALIRSAVEGRDGMWLDLGAGRGTFTKALTEILGPEASILAVDRDPDAVAEIKRWAVESNKRVLATEADFATDGAFATAGHSAVAGLLFANSLHFVKEPGKLLARLVRSFKPGCVVLVEYDRRAPSRWVPFPIGIADLGELAKAAGLPKFRVVESRPSNYEGVIYCAAAVNDVV